MIFVSYDFQVIWAKNEIFPRYFWENALKFLQFCRFELQNLHAKNRPFFRRYTLQKAIKGVKNPENEIRRVE